MRLRDQVAKIIPPEVLPLVSNHFDVIGDIAILDLPPPLRPFGTVLAENIVSRRKNIRTVLNKTGRIAGSSRTAHYEFLAGTTMVTVYHEYGFSYCLDVGTSFFTSRLASERKRVTAMIRPGERVYVPFAGVGPFAIPAAAQGAEVYAVEKNPDACRWLRENITRNRVREHCTVRQGDARDISGLPRGGFDRLIIPAPYGMEDALDTLLPLLAAGGSVHIYTFKTKEELPGLIAAYEEKGLTITYNAPCGNIAPGVCRYVFDMVYSGRP
jgi:tRNA (guanine37-N1)-methyltransferase